MVRLVDEVEEGLAVGAAEGEEFLVGVSGRREEGGGRTGKGQRGERGKYGVSLDVGADHTGAQVAGLVRGDEIGGEGGHG